MLRLPKENNAPIFDLSQLGELAYDHDFVQVLQLLFVHTVPGQLTKLTTAIANKDRQTIASTSHLLKSTFYNVGLRQGYLALDKMERIARNRPSPDDTERLSQLFVYTKYLSDQVVQRFENSN